MEPKVNDGMNRRVFLRRLAGAGLAGALGAGATTAWGTVYVDYNRAWRLAQPMPEVNESDPNVFIFPRFKYLTRTRVADCWDASQWADENLLAFLRNVTNMKVSTKPWRDRVVTIDDSERMYSLPFLFMTGEGDFGLSRQEAATFREYFERGGFLYADDCVAEESSPTADFFYQAFLREIRKVLPGREMKPVPPDHPIYHCFYDFPGHSPHCVGARRDDMGLFIGDRMVAFATSGDVHCGWTGLPHLKHMEQECYRMGVNIVIYALTH